ncbi:MAG: rRNA maturation RNase YbeY, partial [Vicinamibacterales bacterium]
PTTPTAVDPDSSSGAAPPSRSSRFGAAGLSVSVTDGRGRDLEDGGLGRWLLRIAPASARGELAIALVSDARMRALNRAYRRKDYATDVLSFSPLRQGFGGQGHGLGDLVIAKGVAARQAREAGHSLQQELRVLALHGLLHLLGYDHDDPNDAGAMARAEARLRKKGGLRAGLIARSRPRA